AAGTELDPGAAAGQNGGTATPPTPPAASFVLHVKRQNLANPHPTTGQAQGGLGPAPAAPRPQSAAPPPPLPLLPRPGPPGGPPGAVPGPDRQRAPIAIGAGPLPAWASAALGGALGGEPVPVLDPRDPTVVDLALLDLNPAVPDTPPPVAPAEPPARRTADAA